MKTKEQFIEEAKAMMKVRGGCKPFCFYCERWAFEGEENWYCCMMSDWGVPEKMFPHCMRAVERWVKEITE